MKRPLSGGLRHLGPATLLRLLSTSAPTGVLEIDTPEGSVRLELVVGTTRRPDQTTLRHLHRVLEAGDGSFRFEPTDLDPVDGDTVEISALYDIAKQAAITPVAEHFSSDVDVDQLLSGDITDLTRPRHANIHVLPEAPPENPLDELLADLESTAPDELLMAQVGVVAPDPRLWRGPIEDTWRRRGWQLRVSESGDDLELDELDVLVVHHQLSVTRAGREDEWIGLVKRGAASATPVVWVGPLTDGVWVYGLVCAGVTFLMPPPPGDSREPAHRFVEAVSEVVERQIRQLGPRARSEVPHAVAELVDAVLHEADPELALGLLLQLAAGVLSRGAVMMVDDTAFRCRAGFGYPLNPAATALPRGVGLLERIVRSGEAIVELDPEAAGSLQLARVVGVPRLSAATALVPLGSGGSIVGVLVGDRGDQDLPNLDELVLLARRLGGFLIQS